ncbi:MAG: adenylate kinase [bacterium]|nr:adenylate kinase [bacterium]
MNLVFLGPPGSGKGTQARILSERYRIPHIATGDMLREETRRRTEFGSSVKGYMDKGELVPTSVLNGIVLRRFDSDDCSRGFLLDGYPRNVEQAGLLDDLLAELGRTIERVVWFKTDDELVMKRLTGRRTHPNSGRVYNLEFNPPREDGLDDATGESLEQRSDDSEDVVRQRLQVYNDQTVPLIELYKMRGLLVEVNGEDSVENVTEAAMKAVGSPVGL